MIGGMSIVPEDKDWTWVLERPCPECGADVSGLDLRGVAAGLRANIARWRELLADEAATVRLRDDQWSALEYACHVRDAFRIFDERLALILEQDEPRFANWDQDATAVVERYGEQDPVRVLADLEAGGERIAARIEGLRDDQLPRVGHRSDGARFTAETLARYLLHDPVHHVWDIESAYAAHHGS
jgi:hypothetical protein